MGSSRLQILVVLIGVLLAGCSSNGGSQVGAGPDGAPVDLFGESPEVEKEAAGATAPLKANIDQADLNKAIHRYRLMVGKMGGVPRSVGADLNGDGGAEALVLFEGDEWCISTGCELVVFSKGANGFRKMSVVKRVKLPVALAPSFTEGWRDLVVRSGNQSIGEQLVLLKFRGNYPGNATTVAEKLAFMPPRSQILLGASQEAALAQ